MNKIIPIKLIENFVNYDSKLPTKMLSRDYNQEYYSTIIKSIWSNKDYCLTNIAKPVS